MEHLLRELLQLNEVQEILQHIAHGESPAAVTGLAPVHRAQMAAALRHAAGRPLLMLCSDEKEAARQAADLQLLTGCDAILLPERERQLRPALGISRQWEHRRLQSLYRLSQEQDGVVVTTVSALIQRSIPPQVLIGAVRRLTVGSRCDVAALAEDLTAAGYGRCDQVEGPGQFALRGGILDVFSPGMEQPVRCEFFDDEIDSMGAVDLTTQRRIYNCKEALILPAGELLPSYGEGTADAAAHRLETLVGKLARKKGSDILCRTLQADAEALRQGIIPGGCDRYMAAVYPEKATALDYLPGDTLVCISESGRVSESLKATLFQVKEDISAAMENGHAPLSQASMASNFLQAVV